MAGRITFRLASVAIQIDAHTFEKRKIRMVAGHGKNVRRWQRVLCGVRVLTYPYAARFDANDFSIEQSANFSGGNAVFDVGTHPVFQAGAQIRFAMNQGHARASAKQIQGGRWRR